MVTDLSVDLLLQAKAAGKDNITDIENIEAVLINMNKQHFDLLYDDWAFDNRPRNITEKKEIVKFRAKRSIDSMGDSNLKHIEDAFLDQKKL